MQLKRGQSSVEYLTMVGIALAIIVPSSYFILDFASDITQQSDNRRAVLLGSDIVSTVREVYASEKGSFIVLDAGVPDFFLNGTIYGNEEVAFRLATTRGETDMVFFTQGINITNGTSCTTCQLPIEPGFNRLEIYNNGTSITITKR